MGDVMDREARLIDLAITLTVIVLIADSALSLGSGLYLNLGSGVWLSLARDIVDGIFYRPLWQGAAYGGTRYFPLLPIAIAALAQAGVPIVWAGVAVSMIGLAALAAAVFTLLWRIAMPARMAGLGAALAIAPYFVHQTGFAIRSEPLAAAFAIFGMAAAAPFDGGPLRRRQIVLAAVLFVCAFATKLTCVYAPAAVTAALLINRRPADAARVAGLTGGLAVVFLLSMHVGSAGRALESFRACALAGSGLTSLFGPATVTRTLTLIGTSHVLTIVFGAAAGCLAARWRTLVRFPAWYLAAAAAVTAVIFTSPGTILTSQIVDAYVAAIVVLVVALAQAPGVWRMVGVSCLLGLTLWTAAQNGVRILAMYRDEIVRTSIEDRHALVARVTRCAGPVLSESSLVPLVAGQRPALLDAFAFHVVAQNRPEVNADLTARLGRREFRCVVLEHDPESARGAAWYRNVNLTASVVNAVLQNYAYDGSSGGQRFYVPIE